MTYNIAPIGSGETAFMVYSSNGVDYNPLVQIIVQVIQNHEPDLEILNDKKHAGCYIVTDGHIEYLRLIAAPGKEKGTGPTVNVVLEHYLPHVTNMQRLLRSELVNRIN